jgi:hypothetical protein
MKKLMLLAAAAVGYVLGARAGRERYDQIMGVAHRVKDDPRVQEKAQQAMGAAREHAPVVAEKVAGAASAAASKVTGSGSDGSHVDARQPHMAGPQGDLP